LVFSIIEVEFIKSIRLHNFRNVKDRMNKEQLLEAMAAKADITKKQAGQALDAVIDGITDTLKKGNSVALTGFGTFSSSKRAAREGRNPSTGEKIKIAATTVPKFKAGKSLKDAVKGK
jgi:DNA-binding protein HU-beta